MGGCSPRHFLSLVKASAPGKIILFGEHAVVYHRPALAVPVTQVQVDVEVLDSDSTGVYIHAPMVNLNGELNSLPADHAIGSVILKVFSALKVSTPPNLNINITSTIPVAAGLGSGAAVSVALIRTLSSFLSKPFTNEQVNDMVFEIEKLHHGTPSGIDNTVITFGKPVYFIKGQPIETFKVGNPFTIVIGDTGVPAPTKESVGDVRKLWEQDQNKIENIFDQIAEVSLSARRAIESGNPESLGDLMNQNHSLLGQLTVSSRELDSLVESARHAGALGAKLSGGGRGGNMIALVKKETAESVSAALLSAGAKRTIVTDVS
jgi:mevalonate kinase